LPVVFYVLRFLAKTTDGDGEDGKDDEDEGCP